MAWLTRSYTSAFGIPDPVVFNSDLFTFETVVSWPVLAAAAGGVPLAALGSQQPAILSIRRLDAARVVRERAQ